MRLRVCFALGLTAAACLLFMMLLTVTDVILRYMGWPMKGTFELTKLLLVSLVFIGVAYTQVKKGHISVDVAFSRLPKKAQGVVGGIISLLSLGLFSLIAWQGFLQAEFLWLKSQTTGILGIPIWPFLLLVALGSIVLCLLLLVESIYFFSSVVEK